MATGDTTDKIKNGKSWIMVDLRNFRQVEASLVSAAQSLNGGLPVGILLSAGSRRRVLGQTFSNRVILLLQSTPTNHPPKILISTHVLPIPIRFIHPTDPLLMLQIVFVFLWIVPEVLLKSGVVISV